MNTTSHIKRQESIRQRQGTGAGAEGSTDEVRWMSAVETTIDYTFWRACRGFLVRGGEGNN